MVFIINKELYTFLFDLRSSGFVHNSQKNIRDHFYLAISGSDASHKFSANNEGDISIPNLDGEGGVFSAQKLQNLRYSFIVIATSTSLLIPEYQLSREKSASLSDYYISRVDETSSPEVFQQMIQEMLFDFKQAVEQDCRPVYGQPVDGCIEYIVQNLYSNLTVAQVAEHLGYTPSYLSALFKRETGQTLYSYIQAKKLDEARAVLHCTRKPITMIASALGYHSISHFSKAFKAAEGVTPSEYRKYGPNR